MDIFISGCLVCAVISYSWVNSMYQSDVKRDEKKLLTEDIVSDVQMPIENPLALYDKYKNTLLDETGREENVQMKYERACLGLIHIQSVYNIPYKNYTNGILYGYKGPPLDISDFYAIGVLAGKYGLDEEALWWLEISEILLQKDITIIQNQEDLDSKDNYVYTEEETLQNRYKLLCQGKSEDMTINKKVNYCILQPKTISYGYWLKEVLHTNPNIVMFHEVISNKQNMKLKMAAMNELSESTMVDGSGYYFQNRDRISQSGWLDSDSGVVKFVNNVIEDMTELTLKQQEDDGDTVHIQIAKYEPGGVYKPHYDNLGNEAHPKNTVNGGDRIATFMIYLQDVSAGGATVFPKLSVRILPKKNSAVFWFNLLPDGSRDIDSLHAGCPVILGTKWVANKWIREREQLFSKPCLKLRKEGT